MLVQTLSIILINFIQQYTVDMFEIIKHYFMFEISLVIQTNDAPTELSV